MPLGASITYGMGSSDNNGYRAELRSMLLSTTTNLPHAVSVNMVGSRRNGAMIDNDVEGWSGYRIDQVHAVAKASVPAWKPNLVLVNAGTNDAAQNHDVPHAGERMEQMLADVWALSPRATVLLSTLLLNTNEDTERNVVEINEQYAKLVEKLREEGRRIVLVDMHGPEGPLAEDLPDNTHPSNEGYRKMARLWYKGIEEASNMGFIQPPEAVDGLPDDGEVQYRRGADAKGGAVDAACHYLFGMGGACDSLLGVATGAVDFSSSGPSRMVGLGSGLGWIKVLALGWVVIYLL
jgi:lysophospholipase L1-like esterase